MENRFATTCATICVLAFIGFLSVSVKGCFDTKVACLQQGWDPRFCENVGVR